MAELSFFSFTAEQISGYVGQLFVLMLVGIFTFFSAWQLRQDNQLKELQKLMTSLAELGEFMKRLADHNIPDAWKEADKAKDLLITRLTELCTRVICEDRNKNKPS